MNPFRYLFIVYLFLLFHSAVAQPIIYDPGSQIQKHFQPTSSTPPNPSNIINPKPHEINALQAKFFSGRAAGDYFGSCVAGAGDVNGDGYGDIIIGAYDNDLAGTDFGAAYIFYGGAVMDYLPDVIMTGTENGNFGNSVSGAGDVNGDGFADVIVGAPRSNSNKGKAYIYFGGTLMNNTPDVTMVGEAAGDYFATSVSGAGDVNGDGYSDVIAGASNNDHTGSNAGRAYIFFGGSTVNAIADIFLDGANAGDLFGYSVSSAGDFNGDGFSDVIVGAIYADDALLPPNCGSAFIFLGGTSMDNTFDYRFNGYYESDFFGYSVADAGDVNGDGFSDVIIGSMYYDSGGNTSSGMAGVFFGGDAAGNDPVYLLGETSSEFLGESVSSAGDINGDGYSDVIIGARNNDGTGTNAGRAYVLFGGEALDNIPDIILSGESGGESFGNSVACAGDVNGDGLSDIICGAIGNNLNGGSSGRAYLYTNSLSGVDIPDEYFFRGSGSFHYGNPVLSAGDVNGDGYDDILIGAKESKEVTYGYGQAFLHYGGSYLDNTPDITFSGTVASGYLGHSLASGGDLNGDGYPDFVIGVPGTSSGGTIGYVYVYFGGPALDNTPDLTLSSGEANALFGYSVNCSGDVNGDGYSDVIVGAIYSTSSTGRAYVYLGGASMNDVLDLTLQELSPAAGDRFGDKIATADVNKDGYSDIFVSAPNNSYDGIAGGTVLLYYGGATLNSSADLFLNAEADGDDFGISIASAGDVNGDGFPDLIVGAQYSNRNGNNSGCAYIFYGGLNMDDEADIVIAGESEEYLGRAVAGNFDVNGDGFSDYILGAHNGRYNGLNTGKAYIYFGSALLPVSCDITLMGKRDVDYFGYAVGGAGDVNGDGLDDILVGAVYNDDVSADAGKVYLYLSSAPPVKPRIMFVKDVPDDQGGSVTVKFARSAFDSPQLSKVTGYVVERSQPPMVNGFYWETVATIEPVNNTGYLFTSETFADSGTTFFRVTAKTPDPKEFWRSNIMSGMSIDNLVPSAVESFNGSSTGGQYKLTWKRNSEPDLYGYYIYRSNTPEFSLPGATMVAVVKDTTYTDTNPPAGSVYYFIRAKDIHNNYSSVTSCSNNPLPVELSLFHAQVKGGSVMLRWITQTETSCYGFEVERSVWSGGAYGEWEKITFVPAGGTSNAPREYSYTDAVNKTVKLKYRLKITETSGYFSYSSEAEAETGLPVSFALNQNYPNPFNPVTVISYQLPADARVTLEIFNIAGEKVSTLLSGEMKPAGYYSLEFRAGALPNGVYFYRLIAGDYVKTKKLVLMK